MCQGHRRIPTAEIRELFGESVEYDVHTSDSSMPLSRTSRIKRIVASCDCLLRLVGGLRSMPLEIACGLYHNQSKLHMTRDTTCLMTLTDQAKFSGSELRVLNNDDLISWVKVFESVLPLSSV